MSRFAKIMIALLAIAAFAAPAMAADNFSVSGQARALLFSTDDGEDNGTDTFAYQRLRVQGKFTATENVSVTFRSDFVEGNWGTDAANGRLGQIETQMDRMFMDLKFDAFDLRVGTQFVGFGKSSALQWNETGVTVMTKGDMPFTLAYAVDTADTSGNNTAEPEKTLAAIGTKIAGFDIFAGAENDGQEDVYMFGVAGGMDFDAVKVVGEIDLFTGDATATADAKGLQGFVDASMGVSEMTRVGAALYYAQGQDGGDVQYVQLGNYFGQWDPLSRGPFADESFLFTQIPYAMFNAKSTTAASKQQANGAGVVAGQLYVDVQYSDATALTASIAYAEPEEDAAAIADSAMIGNLGVTYMLMDNAKVIGQIQYADWDATGDDADLSVGTGLVVTF
jgi:hypothetical protein